MTPSTDGGGGGMGNVEHHIWALPHHKGTESLWKRWLMVSPGSRPKRRAWRRPIDRIVDTASRLQQPSVSATRGRKETLALLQLEMCSILSSLRNRKSSTLGGGRSCDATLLEWGNNCHIHCSWSTTRPEWKVDICRTRR